MNDQILKILSCPHCRGQLMRSDARSADDLDLHCADCRRSYSTAEGVPRLIVTPPYSGGIARSFGFQWRIRERIWGEGTALYGLSREEERRGFFDGLGIRAEDLSGKTILDVGCGDGFLLQLLGSYPAQVVGIDINSSIEIAARRCRGLPNVTVLQADLFVPPFVHGSFDYVWCEGVLVHTEDPRKGFAALSQLVRPGGRLYIWVYPSAPLSIYQRIRDILPWVHRLPHVAVLALSWALAVPIAVAQRVIGGRKREESVRTIAFALLDNLSPSIQTRHTLPEIRSWFEESRFFDLRPQGLIGMSGTKDRIAARPETAVVDNASSQRSPVHH